MNRRNDFKLLPLAPNTKRQSGFKPVLVIAVGLAFTGGVAFQKYASGETLGSLVSLSDRLMPSGMHAIPASVAMANYPKCYGTTAQRIDCIDDGDTLWVHGVKVRVADIDAPKVSKPRCQYEADLGAKATNRFQELVNSGPFEMQAWPGRDDDKHGRKLRVLMKDGHSLGDILVSEGLARTWTGHREPWC